MLRSPRPRLTLLLLFSQLTAVIVVTGIGTAPAATAATREAIDLKVTQSVYDADGNLITGALPPLVIGQQLKFVVGLTNEMDREIPMSITFSLHPDDDPWWQDPVAISSHLRADDCTDMLVGQTLTVSCPPRLTMGVTVWVTAEVPGRFREHATGAADGEEQNPRNNKVSARGATVCSINGTAGDDVLSGTPDAESICGGAGNDTFTSIGPGDKVFGEGGSDLFIGAISTDTAWAFGGAGTDTVTYQDIDRPLLICGNQEPYYTWAGTAVVPNPLVDIERIIGSPLDDTFIGGPAESTYVAGAGNDLMFGGGGSDVLIGGAGADRFISADRYADAVFGNGGDDEAEVDALDTVESADVVADIAFEDPCRG